MMEKTEIKVCVSFEVRLVADSGPTLNQGDRKGLLICCVYELDAFSAAESKGPIRAFASQSVFGIGVLCRDYVFL